MDSVCLAAKQIWQETGGVSAPPAMPGQPIN